MTKDYRSPINCLKDTVIGINEKRKSLAFDLIFNRTICADGDPIAGKTSGVLSMGKKNKRRGPKLGRGAEILTGLAIVYLFSGATRAQEPPKAVRQIAPE